MCCNLREDRHVVVGIVLPSSVPEYDTYIQCKLCLGECSDGILLQRPCGMTFCSVSFVHICSVLDLCGEFDMLLYVVFPL